MNKFQVIAQRIVNAENSFITEVKEQFSKTDKEAHTILEVFKVEKIVILDLVTGQFSLSNGIFWDIEVMNNALAL